MYQLLASLWRLVTASHGPHSSEGTAYETVGSGRRLSDDMEVNPTYSIPFPGERMEDSVNVLPNSSYKALEAIPEGVPPEGMSYHANEYYEEAPL